MPKTPILGQKTNPDKIRFAIELRLAMTPEEGLLWAQLRVKYYNLTPLTPFPKQEGGVAIVPLLSPCRGEKGSGDERGSLPKPVILGRKTDPDKIHLAKELRHAMTQEESLLWAQLRVK